MTGNPIRGFVAIVAVCIGIAGVVMLAISVGNYLQSGMWNPLNVSDIINLAFPETATFLAWEWIGLWKILAGTSAWFAAIASAVVLLFAATIGD